MASLTCITSLPRCSACPSQTPFALPASAAQIKSVQGAFLVRCEAQGSAQSNADSAPVTRRGAVLGAGAALSMSVAQGMSALAAPPQSLPKTDDNEIKLCDPECEKDIEQIPLVTTPSGLQYRDIVVGKGPSPPVGFQVAADYVAMVPSGRVFDSSIEKKTPYIFRVGSGQVVPGLDEGVLGMNVGGLRRLYIPGNLSFPRGLSSAPGRPRVPPSSPVVFDVKLLYIPGLEDDEE